MNFWIEIISFFCITLHQLYDYNDLKLKICLTRHWHYVTTINIKSPIDYLPDCISSENEKKDGGKVFVPRNS